MVGRKSGNLLRAGLFLDFVRLTTRAPPWARVRRAIRNRFDRRSRGYPIGFAAVFPAGSTGTATSIESVLINPSGDVYSVEYEVPAASTVAAAAAARRSTGYVMASATPFAQRSVDDTDGNGMGMGGAVDPRGSVDDAGAPNAAGHEARNRSSYAQGLAPPQYQQPPRAGSDDAHEVAEANAADACVKQSCNVKNERGGGGGGL